MFVRTRTALFLLGALWVTHSAIGATLNRSEPYWLFKIERAGGFNMPSVIHIVADASEPAGYSYSEFRRDWFNIELHVNPRQQIVLDTRRSNLLVDNPDKVPVFLESDGRSFLGGLPSGYQDLTSPIPLLLGPVPPLRVDFTQSSGHVTFVEDSSADIDPREVQRLQSRRMNDRISVNPAQEVHIEALQSRITYQVEGSLCVRVLAARQSRVTPVKPIKSLKLTP